MVGVVAGSPGNGAPLPFGNLIGLAFETRFVDAVLAYGAVLNSYIPTPQCHCIPLLDFNSFVDLHSKYYMPNLNLIKNSYQS